MLLERLSNACGVSGYEDEVRDLLRDELNGCGADQWTDAIGNLIVRKGDGPYRVMLAAHMDEVGFCVGAITDDGYLKLKKIGGIDDRVLPGRQVWVTNRRIPGVIGAKAWHLTSGEERAKVIPLDRMYVDLGCRSRAEVAALGIEPGDPAYFATAFEAFSPEVVKGKAFDDRAGCAVLAALLQRYEYPGLTLYGVFTAQEEVGLRGARVAAYNLDPDLALALEGTGSGAGPDIGPLETITALGAGPALTLMDNSVVPDLRVFEQLTRVAVAHGIPHQVRRQVAGGTDSGGIALQRRGVPTCTVSVPCRYIHTNAALLNLNDLEATIALIHQFMLTVAKGEFRP